MVSSVSFKMHYFAVFTIGVDTLEFLRLSCGMELKHLSGWRFFLFCFKMLFSYKKKNISRSLIQMLLYRWKTWELLCIRSSSLGHVVHYMCNMCSVCMCFVCPSHSHQLELRSVALWHWVDFHESASKMLLLFHFKVLACSVFQPNHSVSANDSIM